MRFVNAIEHDVAVLLGEERRIRPRRSSEAELAKRLREEVAHIQELLDENDRLAQELGDANATNVVLKSVRRLIQFSALIDREFR